MARPGRAFLLIFLVHLGVQGFFLTRVPTKYVRPHTRWEVPAVAMALYERGEFADPYCLPTGATAHMPPFQPALMTAVYLLLGPTLAAGYVLWLVSIAFHGVMYAMLPWLGERLGLGARAGLVGGLVGAVIPRWPSYVEGLAAVAIGLMAAAFVRRWGSGHATSGGSFALGLAIGLSFYVTPSLLPVALGLVGFEILWLREPRRWRWAALTLLGMTLACVPWTWRNYQALGSLFFIRSNFGLELRMGNHEGAGPTLESSARGGTERHPRTDLEEARKAQQQRAGRNGRNRPGAVSLKSRRGRSERSRIDGVAVSELASAGLHRPRGDATGLTRGGAFRAAYNGAVRDPGGKPMDRKQFLKASLCLGAFSGAPSLAQEKPAAPEKDPCADAVGYARHWVKDLIDQADAQLPEPQRRALLEARGRSCAKGGATRWAEPFRGQLDEFVADVRAHIGRDAASREGNVVTVTYPRCFCPLVADFQEPLSASYCFCSAGWLKEVYETVSGKPVSVEILETVKRGGQRCRFEVKLGA
jgi:hypothetical protein